MHKARALIMMVGTDSRHHAIGPYGVHIEYTVKMYGQTSD